jgi:hypothetical protein
MFHNASTLAREPRPTAKRLAWSCVFALAAVIFAAGCEDKALGRPCTIVLKTDASVGAAQSVYNTGVPDCPSHICTKPAVQPGVSNDLDTGPYCTVACSSDNDCNGQTRDFSNPSDKRCMKGFTCAIPFDQGSLCCQKLCLCRDFYSSAVGPAVPAACQNDAGASCS